MSPRSPDQRIAEVAAHQHSAFTRALAKACGFTDAMIRHRQRCGRWLLKGPVVFVLSGSADTWEQRAKVAGLQCGPISAVSGVSAAASWGLGPRRPTLIDVTIAHDKRAPRISGVIVKRSRYFARTDFRTLNDIPVTSPERTLVDLCIHRQAKA